MKAEELETLADLLRRADEEFLKGDWVPEGEAWEPVFCTFCSCGVVPISDGRRVCPCCSREVTVILREEIY